MTKEELKKYYNSLIWLEDLRQQQEKAETQEQKKHLTERIKQAQKDIKTIKKYIDNIQDIPVKRAIIYRYEYGMKWQDVADNMFCDRTYPEKMIKKYLEEHQ